MVKRPRGDMGVKAEAIAGVLSKAGWEWRHGGGSHEVLTKPGRQQIVLTGEVTMAQWKNIERSVGVEVESLLTKQYKRGRGIFLSEAELRKRVELAWQLWQAGFPSNFVTKHSGLANPRFEFRPALFDELGLEGVLRKVLGRKPEAVPHPPPLFRTLPVEPVQVGNEVELAQAPSVVREGAEASDEVDEVQATPPPMPGVPVAEVAVVKRDEDLRAIIDLLAESNLNVRQVIAQRQKRSQAYLAAFRRVAELRQHFDRELELLIEEMGRAWNEEGAMEGGE